MKASAQLELTSVERVLVRVLTQAIVAELRLEETSPQSTGEIAPPAPLTSHLVRHEMPARR